MKHFSQYLVVNGKGGMRLRMNPPQRRDLRPDELAFRINVSIPEAGGRLSEQVIELTFPENPEPTAEVTA